MNRKALSHRTILGWSMLACAVSVVGALPLALVGCDKEVSKTTETKTKTSDTPEGVKKTTETTEKKVETEKKP